VWRWPTAMGHRACSQQNAHVHHDRNATCQRQD
jgi:hypothetical protein